ncbi:MAG: Na+/H+ antiporter subunit D [Planctomycetota bacterium]|nr:MAG: Na+/H+ antiporter subunit D [Planctomycetota bacterium]REJ87520.1 MAG: Na+/H+ antiporter subunit D [Planctomycetota bacterium]
MKSILLVLPLLVPLSTAAVCLVLWTRPWLQRAVSLLGTVTLLLAGVSLVSLVASEGIQVIQLGNWQAPVGITIVADLFGAIMVAVSGLVAFSVVLYSMQGIDRVRESFGFHSLLHVLFLGVNGSFLTGDVFNLYVWFETMLIASFVLVALGGEKAQLEGAIKYATLNLVSSAIFLAAAGVLYGTVGTLNMADLAQRIGSGEVGGVASVAGAMLLVSFGLKAGLFPLFFWLPASYHTPPAVISAVMAGLLTKVGVYALVRVVSLLFVRDLAYLQPLLLVVAGLTMVTGVLGAAAQGEFRRVLSFHIISQIGYMILGLALFTPLALAGMVFYLVHHIIVKTNLFLIAGIAHRVCGSYRLEQLGGIYRSRLWLALLFLVPAMSLAGIPPLSGFWAKLALVRAGLETEHYLVTAAALAVGLLTLFSMTKIWNEAFWKRAPASSETQTPPPSASQPPASQPPTSQLPSPAAGLDSDATLRATGNMGWMVAASLLLALLTVGIGFFAEPLFALANETAAQLLNPAEYIEAVLPKGA